MKIRLKADGREFEGTPEEIVSQMRSVAGRDQDDLATYMRWAAENARDKAGVDIPREALASPESFLRATIDHGMAEEA
jgi:hypothetical protein